MTKGVVKVGWKMFLLILSVLVSSSTMGSELQEIGKVIQKRGAKWTAGETTISKRSHEQERRLLGDYLGAEILEASLMDTEIRESFPDEFDWRDKDGHFWMTPIRDQGGCGTAFVYAVVGALEANIKIHANNHWIMPDFCEEDSIPYWRISNSGWTEPAVDSIKAAIYKGPVVGQFDVYDDFFGYAGGVYEHISGSYLGEHSVTMLGWSDADSCWICKNSWGPGWGEQGWFRIKYGRCGIEDGGAYWLVPVSWGRDGAVIKETVYQFNLFPDSFAEDSLLVFNTFETDPLDFIFDITSYPTWLTPSITSDTLSGGDSVYVEFEVSSAGLEGAYAGTLMVVISDSSGEPPKQWPVRVELDVNTLVIEGGDDNSVRSLTKFALKQNCPNPFNPATELRYSLAADCHVRLEIYNILGRKVATLVNQRQRAGSRSLRWNASSFSSGVYFCRLQAGDFVETKKLLLLK